MINTLVFIYIILGYIYFGIPIIILILACLCMPVLIFLSIIFARRAQIPANDVEYFPIILLRDI